MKKSKKEISIKEMMYSNKGAHNTIISFKDHLDTFMYEGKDYEDMYQYMIANYDYYDDDNDFMRDFLLKRQVLNDCLMLFI